MNLYTFFLEYRGGTYISQVLAENFKTAPKIWAEKLSLTQIADLEENFTGKLAESIKFDLVVPVDGMINTWACSLVYIDGATVHFTQTAK